MLKAWPSVRGGAASFLQIDDAQAIAVLQHLGIRDQVGELAVVERGGIVAKVIATSDRSEILSLSAMRVRTTPAKVRERFLRVETWRRDPWVIQIGVVGPTPSTANMEGLTLDSGDVKHLSRCRVGDCDIRLPADAIERSFAATNLPDVDYGIEQHNWSNRTDALLAAIEKKPN
jgi:hypothetical protein